MAINYFLFTAESAEALLSIKSGGFKVKRELDFGEDQNNQPMTLGPEMFGLKRIGEPVLNQPKPVSNAGQVLLNRRGTVRILVFSCT